MGHLFLGKETETTKYRNRLAVWASLPGIRDCNFLCVLLWNIFQQMLRKYSLIMVKLVIIKENCSLSDPRLKGSKWKADFIRTFFSPAWGVRWDAHGRLMWSVRITLTYKVLPASRGRVGSAALCFSQPAKLDKAGTHFIFVDWMINNKSHELVVPTLLKDHWFCFRFPLDIHMHLCKHTHIYTHSWISVCLKCNPLEENWTIT